MLQSLTDLWNETMQVPEARWIVWGTLLLFAVMIAIYISFFFRNLAIGGADDESADLLTEFRNMRDLGQIKADEYSKLKTKIPGTGFDELGSPTSSSGGTRVENSGNGTDNEPEKKFLTLAEAQARKKELERQKGSDENEQVDEDA